MDNENRNSQEEQIVIEKYSSLKEQCQENNLDLIASYIGTVNQQVVISICYYIEKQLELQGESKRVIKRICNVTIEVLQNIIFHAERNDEGYHLAYFLVEREKSIFRVYSCNHIHNEYVYEIQTKFEMVKNTGKSDLNLRYLEILEKGKLSAKGKAGLGLITIALNSDGRLEYNLNKTSNDYSLLELKSEIKVF